MHSIESRHGTPSAPHHLHAWNLGVGECAEQEGRPDDAKHHGALLFVRGAALPFEGQRPIACACAHSMRARAFRTFSNKSIDSQYSCAGHRNFGSVAAAFAANTTDLYLAACWAFLPGFGGDNCITSTLSSFLQNPSIRNLAGYVLDDVMFTFYDSSVWAEYQIQLVTGEPPWLCVLRQISFNVNVTLVLH